MKFNKHNSYRNKKTSFPNCPRCKTNIHVVKLIKGYRCAFCDQKIIIKGQQEL